MFLKRKKDDTAQQPIPEDDVQSQADDDYSDPMPELTKKLKAISPHREQTVWEAITTQVIAEDS